jgi:peptide/nickel transport system substrate-binding protein
MWWLGSALATEVTVFEADPPTLNPLYASTPSDRRAQELVFDWLFYRSAHTGRWRSVLVRAQQLSADGRELTLTLRDDVTWHDGERFDASDVCFTIAVLLDPAAPSPLARQLRSSLAGCTAEGHRAVIRFSEAHAQPHESLVFAVLPQHRFSGTAISSDDPFARAPIGTGPMRVRSAKASLRFEAFASPHHDPALLSSPSLRLVYQTEPLSQVRALLDDRNTLGITLVAPPYRPDIAASDTVALRSSSQRCWWFMALDTRAGPTRDVHVRRALAATLDRTNLLERTVGIDPNDTHPVATLISGPFVPASPYYNRQVPLAQPDAARADEQMRAAGAVREQDGKRRWMLDGQPVTLRIGVQSALESEARELDEAIADQLRAGGFEVELLRISPQGWAKVEQTGQATGYDALVGKWTFGVLEVVDPLFHTREDEQGSHNLFGYSDARVDALLDRFDQAHDDSEATRAYHALHALLAEDLPYLFLWKLDTKSAWRPEARDPALSPLPFLSDRPAWAEVLPFMRSAELEPMGPTF